MIEKRGAFEGRNQPGASRVKASEMLGVVGGLIYTLFALAAIIEGASPASSL